MLPILSPDVVTTLPLRRPVRSLSVMGIWFPPGIDVGRVLHDAMPTPLRRKQLPPEFRRTPDQRGLRGKLRLSLPRLDHHERVAVVHDVPLGHDHLDHG